MTMVFENWIVWFVSSCGCTRHKCASVQWGLGAWYLCIGECFCVSLHRSLLSSFRLEVFFVFLLLSLQLNAYIRTYRAAGAFFVIQLHTIQSVVPFLVLCGNLINITLQNVFIYGLMPLRNTSTASAWDTSGSGRIFITNKLCIFDIFVCTLQKENIN